MSPRRPTVLILSALLALLALPASALAQAPPTNDTVLTPGAWQTAPYNVTLEGTDPDGVGLTMEWQLDNGAITTGLADGTPITIPGPGNYVFKTRAVDADGDSGWRSEPLRIDPVDPTDASAPITSPAASGWHLAPTSFEVTAVDITSGVDHVEWILDGAAVQSGPNGSNVPISSGGPHLLRTRAVDNAGNVSDWTDHTIRIDAVLPTDTTVLPTGWRTTPVDVVVKGVDTHSGVDQVAWILDGGLQTIGSPTGSFTISTDGEHTVQTIVRDVAGNESGWTTHLVKIDRTVPSNVTAVSDGEWKQSYHVLVEGVDPVSGVDRVEWQIDSGPWLHGPSGSAVDFAGTGEYVLRTRIRDKAGNLSPTRSDNVRIDVDVPTNTTPAPPGGTVSSPYQRAVNGTDPDSGVDSVEWQVDGGAVNSGAPGALATVSGSGSHTLKTRVIDAAGNASAWRTDTVNVDATLGDNLAPVDTTTAAPSGWRATAVNVTVAASDAGSGVKELEWRIDGQPKQTWPGASPSFQITGEGEHLLETRAIDVAGNTSPWRAQTFKIDLTVPVDETVIATEWQRSRTFTLEGSDARSDLDEIEYRINGVLYHGDDGDVVDVGADGTYTIVTRAIDNAGHASAPKTVTFKVDTVVPGNSSAVPASGWQASTLSLPLTGTDDRSGIGVMQWRLNSGAIQDGGPAVVDTDGVHTLQTRAVDAAGNVSAWRSDTVRVDRTAPTNTTPAPGGWRNSAYSVTVQGADGAGSGVDRIERKIDGGGVSTDPNVTISGDGVYALHSRIVDEVGHASAWREDVIRIDTVAPTAGISCSSGQDVWSTAPVSCTVTGDGGPSGLPTLTLSGADGGTASVPSGTVATVGSDGRNLLRLEAVDGAGNSVVAEAMVNVDRSAPAAGVSCASAAGTYTCWVDASDPASGLAALAWSVDGGTFKDIAAGESFTVSQGKVRLRARDAAGNEVVTEPVTLPALKGGPTVRVTSAPVYLKGRRSTESLVGALTATRSASGTVSLDLRPLAVGRGRYRVEVSLKAGKRTRTVKRNYKVGRTGALPRMSASLTKATTSCKVKLTVRKRVGTRWRSHASTHFVLAK